MKLSSTLALAAATTAFILPDEQVANLRHVETVFQDDAKKGIDAAYQKVDALFEQAESVFSEGSNQLIDEYHQVQDNAEDAFDWVSSKTSDLWDYGVSTTKDAAEEVHSRLENVYSNTKEWVHETAEDIAEADRLSTLGHGHHEHHGHHGHHGHHHSNLTVYQLIAKSNYTTKLAELINKYDDIVKALNSTNANYTVFAPIDRAFEKIPKDAKPSKEFLEALLSYHVSPDFYPAGRVLVSRTIPTLLKSPALGEKPKPQRLVTNIGFRGLTVDFYSRVVAVDIFGSNGVIHGVDSILVPPPSGAKIVELLPSEFSTLQLALVKTGLYDNFNSTADENYGTAFLPSNFAFLKLGTRANAFLFSSYGLKYLKPLLQYHIVPHQVLYSDAFYKSSAEEATGIPKGYYHVDLPTVLEDHSLSIDISRFGRLIDIQINGYVHVANADLVAYNGVIHSLNSVLFPPKKLADGTLDAFHGGEISVEELKERLEPYVDHGSNAWQDL